MEDFSNNSAIQPERHQTNLLAIVLAGLIGGVVGGTYPQWSQNLPANLRPDIVSNQNQRPNFVDDRKVVTSEENAVTNVVKTASPGVVSIVAKSVEFDVFAGPQNTEQGIGTGFIIDSGGIIVTNNHVVENKSVEYTVYTKDKKSYPVVKIDQDPTNDIAILKVNATGLPTVDLGNSDNLQVGQTAVAIGNALGRFDNTVTVGVISGIGRGVTAGNAFGGRQESLENVIQTDAALNPGNSGGPLLNLDSKVVGVNFAVTANAQNIGFVIPINKVKPIIDGYKKTGAIQRAYLGVGFGMVSKEVSEQRSVPEGAFVTQVASGSPAEKAGIKVRDIITKIAGESLTSENPLDQAVSIHKPGDQIDIEVYRGTTRQTLKAGLEQVPARL